MTRKKQNTKVAGRGRRVRGVVRAPSFAPQSNASEGAEAAGEQYASDQLQGDYFMDWVREQMLEASRAKPSEMLPLETKSDALVIAKNMLQQLLWDTQRGLEKREMDDLLGAVGVQGSDETATAFYEGFKKTLDASRDWLADELLQIKQEMRSSRVSEARRSTPDSGPTTLTIDDGLEARRLRVGVPSKTLKASTETWVVHRPGDPGNSVLQVDIFKPQGRPWAAWTGNFTRARDREIAERVAAARNGTGAREARQTRSPKAKRSVRRRR